MIRLSKTNNFSLGQAMTEFVVILPVFYLIIFGTIQVGLIFYAQNALNYATFQAARIGALNNATYSGIRKGLVRGIGPLFTNSDDLTGIIYDIKRAESDEDSCSIGLSTGATQGIPCTQAATEVDEFMRIIRLSPQSSDFLTGGAGFGEGNYQTEDGQGNLIPNDNLMYRSSAISGSGVSIQDANLLKIKVQYCYELSVPMVSKMIGSLSELNNLNDTPQHPDFTPNDPRFADLNEGAADDIAGRSLASYSELCADRTDDIRRGFMISSEAIVRMQSAAYDVDPDEDFGDKMCDGTHMACP